MKEEKIFVRQLGVTCYVVTKIFFLVAVYKRSVIRIALVPNGVNGFMKDAKNKIQNLGFKIYKNDPMVVYVCVECICFNFFMEV